jgi:hypothetical protein
MRILNGRSHEVTKCVILFKTLSSIKILFEKIKYILKDLRLTLKGALDTHITILRLKLRYFSHVMRAKRSLERDIMLGEVAGYRRQGKPRMRWLDSIKEATGLPLEVLKETVQDRKKWRMLVEEKTRNRERTNVK